MKSIIVIVLATLIFSINAFSQSLFLDCQGKLDGRDSVLQLYSSEDKLQENIAVLDKMDPSTNHNYVKACFMAYNGETLLAALVSTNYSLEELIEGKATLILDPAITTQLANHCKIGHFT